MYSRRKRKSLPVVVTGVRSFSFSSFSFLFLQKEKKGLFALLPVISECEKKKERKVFSCSFGMFLGSSRDSEEETNEGF